MALKNFTVSTVATAPSPSTSGTSLTVEAGQGTLFAIGPAIVWPPGVEPLSTNAEIVDVTAIVTDTLTITRAQEGTTAQAIAVGWQIEQGVTAGVLAGFASASVITAGSIGGATAVPEITYNAAGQITGVASVAPDDTSKIPLSTVTAAGDLIVGSGAGSVSRLGIGANGDVLTVAAGALGYAAPASGALSYVESYVTATESLNASTPVNLTSVSLAAGTWFITASAFLATTEATSSEYLAGIWIGPTSASASGGYTGANTVLQGTTPANAISWCNLVATQVVVLTATTTVYLVAEMTGTGVAYATTSANINSTTVPNVTGITAVKIA